MLKVKVSETKDYFKTGNKNFFYFADTVWSAFSNISIDEWEKYLTIRKKQGFNVFQANILTQWDAGKPDMNIYPFKVDKNGKFDFYSINEEYFKRAREMLSIANKIGLIPALVVLWGNYVKDTWMLKYNPINVMPFDIVKTYCVYVVKMFSEFNPIFIISGDTNFESEETIKYYITALETIKSLSPESLTTMHLAPCVELPEIFINSKHLDFYMYQSEHNIEFQDNIYKNAQNYYNKPVKRPIVNGEPCYEFHFFGGKYGRYNEFNVRKAFWQSVLSGAKAGFTYGAQGIWSWHREGKIFSNEPFGGKPLVWQKALNLKGANDISFAKQIYEKYNMFYIEPVDKILNKTNEICMSESKDGKQFFIYIPYNIDIDVSLNLSEYKITIINLATKKFFKPEIEIKKEFSRIKMHDFNNDVLIIGEKNK